VSGFDTVIVRFYFTGYQQKVGMYSWENLKWNWKCWRCR